MAVNYKFVDSKLGTTTGGASVPAATLWAASTAYAVGAVVQNGGFLFRCSVAGTSAPLNAAPLGSGPTPQVLTDNTVTWVLVGPVSHLCSVDSAAAQELGYQALGKDPTYGVGTFKYVKFTGVCNPGDIVAIDQCNATCTQASTSSAKGYIGICMGRVTASGQFGWVMIQGVHDQLNLTVTAVAGQVSLSATAGQGTAGAAGSYADGLLSKATPNVASNGVAEAYWPTFTGR